MQEDRSVQQAVAAIVGALRVMLPPGDATDRLAEAVEALPALAIEATGWLVKRCPVCGVEFTGRHPAAVYCSDRCGTLARMRQYRLRRGDGQAVQAVQE